MVMTFVTAFVAYLSHHHMSLFYWSLGCTGVSCCGMAFGAYQQERHWYKHNRAHEVFSCWRRALFLVPGYAVASALIGEEGGCRMALGHGVSREEANALVMAWLACSSFPQYLIGVAYVMESEARPSPIPSLCTHFTRAGIEWRR